MKTDEISSRIFSALYEGDLAILRRYSAPEHLTPNRQRAEIEFMVLDILSELPNRIDRDELEQIIFAMHQNIRKTCRARSWPSVAQFVAATKLAVSELGTAAPNSARGLGSSGDFKSDKIAANRMNAGEPVGDNYLYGSACVRLLESGAVSQQKIDAYRHSVFKSECRTVGEDKALALRAGREAHHAKFVNG